MDALCYFTYYIINSRQFEIFDPFLNQLDSVSEMSRDCLRTFFRLCEKYYPMIDSIVEDHLSALKILIRMLSVLSINEENMIIGIPEAGSFASKIFQIVSTDFESLLSSIEDNEWPSFCRGLIHLFSIHLLYEKVNNQQLDLLSKIPNLNSRKEEMIINLIDSLASLRVRLPIDQSTFLIGLVGQNDLTLQHLELASSLDAYISFLTQFVIDHFETDIDSHLTKVLTENRFPSNSNEFSFEILHFSLF